MWIFGYGSLMSDEWERTFNCTRRENAILLGYERSFTKLSIRNWGTKMCPAPTLRVVRRDGAECHGVAFEFGPAVTAQVIEYLQEREGKNFQRETVRMKLESGELINGECFFYDGNNVITDDDVGQLIEMTLQASGRDGTGVDYIRKIRRELECMGIHDENVNQLYDAVTQRLEEC